MNKQKTLWITALFFLLMGLAQFSWAEPSPEEDATEQARVAEFMNRAAKTQEEFLRRVKAVWDKPEASMTEVAETITGVSMKWFRAYPMPTLETKYYAVDLEYELHPDAPYHGSFVENVPEKAQKREKWYRLPAGVFIRDELWLSFYGQTRRDNPQRNLCVTAGKTREILGEPTQMHLEAIGHNRLFGYEYFDGKRRMTFRYDGVKRVPPRKSPLEVVLDRTKDTCLLEITYEYLY